MRKLPLGLLVALVSIACLAAAPTAAQAAPKYPPCGPYTSEGTFQICRLAPITVRLEGTFLSSCRFRPPSDGCSGWAKGPFPFAQEPAGSIEARVRISWHQDGDHRVLEYSIGDSNARLDGTLPNEGSDRFTVTGGFARNSFGGNNGDRFYTPEIPGQKPGEVGGPLKWNWENGTAPDYGSKASLEGYLYLKH
jgi:hypothetical protein